MKDQKDHHLDEIYDTIDLLMKNGKWIILNQLFELWESRAWRTDLDILLGYATASLPGKSKIPHRAVFMDKCKRLYPDKKLWSGLE